MKKLDELFHDPRGDLFTDPPNPADLAKASIRRTLERMYAPENQARRDRWKECRARSKSTAPDFNQRTKDLLHERGFLVVRTETYNAFAQRKNDLMGFADQLAIKAGEPAVCVQITGVSNMSSRRNKIRDSKLAQTWLQTGNKILLIGWQKIGPRWQAREEWL